MASIRSEKGNLATANPELLRVPMVPMNISGLQKGTVAIFLQVSRTAVLSMVGMMHVCLNSCLSLVCLPPVSIFLYFVSTISRPVMRDCGTMPVQTAKGSESCWSSADLAFHTVRAVLWCHYRTGLSSPFQCEPTCMCRMYCMDLHPVLSKVCICRSCRGQRNRVTQL